MSQKNQGNKQSMKQGADRGHPGKTETVHDIERVGGKGDGAHSFNVPDHHEHCHVSGPKGAMDK